MRLGEIVSLLGDGIHGTPTYDETGEYFFINGNNLSDGVIEIKENTKKVSITEYEKHKKELTDRTVLVSINGTIGNVAFYDGEPVILGKSACYFNLFSQIEKHYIKKLINSSYFLEYALKSATGSTIKNVSLKAMREFCVPLPPLPEQHRIVDRLDQLMARCDELEKMRKEREEMRLEVHAAAIRQLLDPTAFATSCANNLRDFVPSCETDNPFAFLARHFGELYTVKENVAELRKAILQIAVMGRLVPQDPNDPPASELLKEIEAEKQRLVKAGKIKQPKLLPHIKPEEVPHELPQGWEWVTLQDVGFFLGGKTPSKNKPKYWDGDIPWVSPKDMKCLEIKDSEDHVTAAGVESGLAIIPEQSILMVVRSGILRRMFPVAVNNLPCTINQDLKALVPYLSPFSSYLLLMLRGFEQFILEKLTKQGVTVESVKFDEFANTKFPLPPLPEQHRIVAKIDQLTALCDTLEQQIDAATGKQTELLDAVMGVL